MMGAGAFLLSLAPVLPMEHLLGNFLSGAEAVVRGTAGEAQRAQPVVHGKQVYVSYQSTTGPRLAQRTLR